MNTDDIRKLADQIEAGRSLFLETEPNMVGLPLGDLQRKAVVEALRVASRQEPVDTALARQLQQSIETNSKLRAVLEKTDRLLRALRADPAIPLWVVQKIEEGLK